MKINIRYIKNIKREELSKKGQFFSYDAIVAGILFILLLTLLYNYWNSIRTTIAVRIDDSTRVAISVSNLLLTPGSPMDWNSTKYNQIGLTKDYNTIEISDEKVANLSVLSLDYNSLKEKLGVGPYEILIKINNTSIGFTPSEATTSEVTIHRPVIYNGSLQNLSITIWSYK